MMDSALTDMIPRDSILDAPYRVTPAVIRREAQYNLALRAFETEEYAWSMCRGNISPQAFDFPLGPSPVRLGVLSEQDLMDVFRRDQMLIRQVEYLAFDFNFCGNERQILKALGIYPSYAGRETPPDSWKAAIRRGVEGVHYPGPDLTLRCAERTPQFEHGNWGRVLETDKILWKKCEGGCHIQFSYQLADGSGGVRGVFERCGEYILRPRYELEGMAFHSEGWLEAESFFHGLLWRIDNFLTARGIADCGESGTAYLREDGTATALTDELIGGIYDSSPA